jgi:hypothetical protein
MECFRTPPDMATRDTEPWSYFVNLANLTKAISYGESPNAELKLVSEKVLLIPGEGTGYTTSTLLGLRDRAPAPPEFRPHALAILDDRGGRNGS